MSRRTAPVETAEYGQMVRRMVRAYGRRVAEADEVDLAELLALRAELETAVSAAITGQRARGASWAMIARATGTTRQAAQMRYGAQRRPEQNVTEDQTLDLVTLAESMATR